MQDIALKASTKGDTTVQSVDRAVTILELLARYGEAGVSEIARELDVHRSTAFRLLAVLERRGLAEQVSERGKYRLGFRLLQLASATTARLDLTQLSRQVCEWLAVEVGETVNIAILESRWAVNIAQVRGVGSLTADNWIGQRTPLHATSSGKVLLAYLPPEDQEPLLAGQLDRCTEATITDPEQLRVELEKVRAQGYATTSEELEVGLNAIAAPIRSHEGEVVAAISVSGPSYRLGGEAMPAAIAAVVKAADEVSDRLGFRA